MCDSYIQTTRDLEFSGGRCCNSLTLPSGLRRRRQLVHAAVS